MSTAPGLPPAPPAPFAHPGENDDNSNWQAEVLTTAPVHHLGHFLDRFAFAALQTTSAIMQTSLRNVIRARSEELPVKQRMTNLAEAFCVCAAHKELLRREGRQPADIIAVGGQGDTVMSLDVVTKRYTTLARMLTGRECQHVTAVLDGKLFVLGGEEEDTFGLTSVECLDPETMQWTAVGPMSRGREYFAAAALGAQVFVTSEEGNECFDPTTGAWTALPPMSTPRYGHAMVSANGKLYVAGGRAGGVDNNHQHLNLKSVECFDPTTRVWTTIAPLNEARALHGLAVLGDKLYAMGGMAGRCVDEAGSTLSSVECLDLSIPDGQWTPVASMTMGRNRFGTVVAGGKIYVIGGKRTADEPITAGFAAHARCFEVDNIDCFDPKPGTLGQWAVTHESLEFHNTAAFAAM